MSVSSVTSRSTCISGSRCAIVFHSCYTWLYFVVFERHFYTIGELWANSFNANARKSKQQFWIQKVDANPCYGELLWSNNRTPNWNLAWAKIDDSKKLAAEKHRFAQRRSSQKEDRRETKPPTQTLLGVRHAFLPHQSLLKRRTTSVRRYGPIKGRFPTLVKYVFVIFLNITRDQIAN